MRFGRSLLAGDRRYPALESVLRREPFDRDVQTTDLDEMEELLLSLDGGHLVIQGPPGSGKTWMSGRLIARLLAAGKRVGVASTSHKAIHKLLEEVEAAGIDVRGRQEGERRQPGVVLRGRADRERHRRADCVDAPLLGGTAWLFAHGDLDGELDYLFIDEAGQVSLADALAMGTAARNLVLVGDPLQLAQVLQGTHPEGAGASVLQHLLGEHATIPADRGLFLERTFRLHPDVCGYISEEFYEGRLAHDPCHRGRGRRRSGPGCGSSRSSTRAAGRSRRRRPRRSRREVERAARGGRGRASEIMVVAPYNAQVNLLRERLPEAVRVGTVDKFQGQEGEGRPLLDGELERRRRPARARVPALAQPPERRDLARAVPRVPRLRARGCSRSTAARSTRCASRTRSAASSSSPRSRRRERPARPEVVLGASGGAAGRRVPGARGSRMDAGAAGALPGRGRDRLPRSDGGG